jgi:hypothetical protein
MENTSFHGSICLKEAINFSYKTTRGKIKKSRTADYGWSSSLGGWGRGLTNPRRKNSLDNKCYIRSHTLWAVEILGSIKGRVFLHCMSDFSLEGLCSVWLVIIRLGGLHFCVTLSFRTRNVYL